MGADSRLIMQNWVDTLQYIIEIASERGRVQRERWSSHQVDSIALQSVQQVMHGQGPSSSQPPYHPHSPLTSPHDHRSPQPQREFQEPQEEGGNLDDVPKPVTEQRSFRFQHHKLPTLRLNVDINTMPPGSTQRNQFEEMFSNDVSRAAGIDSRFVEIISVKPLV